MTKEELAAEITGAEYQYGFISHRVVTSAKENELVVVYGHSDDLVEFRGAFTDEDGEGENIYLDENGIFKVEDCDCYCTHYKRAIEQGQKRCVYVKGTYDGPGDWVWSFECELPHATFDLFEDGENYCRGIVFSMEDLRDEVFLKKCRS